MRSESVLESRVRCPWINEVRPAELTHVAQALEDFGIDKPERELVDADVVPDGIAQNLEARDPFIPVGSR